MSNYMPFAHFGHQIVPFDKATISIASHSLQYGTTCFGGIRGYVRDNEIRIFRLKDHHLRLMQSSKTLGMNFYIDWESFRKVVFDLIEANAPTGDFYLRPFLFTQDVELAPKPLNLRFEMAVYAKPLNHYFPKDRGLKLMISSWRKFSDASLPTKAKAGGCYVNSFLASGEALRGGYDEALLMDHHGHIVEASVANLLLSYHGRVISPSIGSAQLEGITLRTAIDLLKDEGISVCFETIDRSMTYGCDELILTGTAAQFTFADSVDGKMIGDVPRDGPGPICALIREKWEEIIEMKHARSKIWIESMRRTWN